MFENMRKEIKFTASNSMFDQKLLESLLDNQMTNPFMEKVVGCEYTMRNIADAMCVFDCRYGVHPNKIIIGRDLYEDFAKYTHCVKLEESEETKLDDKNGIIATFYGVPFEVDENNPKRLEIGYMIRLS